MVLSLAPLHGVTGRVFRNAFFEFFPGFDEAFAPFIPSTIGATPGEKQFRDLLPEAQREIALVPQILGNDAESFIATAKVLVDFGYSEINWNLGCPYPMVANKKRGSGLLPFPDLIDRFLEQALPRVSVPVSVKIRLGRNGAGEMRSLVPVLNRHPLKRIIIHPRLGVQMYEGEVDLDGFAAAAAALSHEIAYNGDIKSAAVFAALRERFPAVRQWMIGRWALANPFLPGDLRGLPRPLDPRKTLKAFHDVLYAEYSDLLCDPAHALDKMKEIWGYLSRSFSNPERLGKKIARAKKTADYEDAVRSAFDFEVLAGA